MLGIYFYSIVGIVSKLLGINLKRAEGKILIVVVFITHSAALRYLLINSLGNSWGYLFDGGFASQRMLGPVFQPASFGVLLLLATYLFIIKKPYFSAILVSIASVFHPSIIHLSATLIVAFVIIIILEEGNYKKGILVGFTSLVTIFPIVIYLYKLISPSSTEISMYVNEMLVNFRNPHHAIPAVWFDLTSAIKIIIIIGAIYALRNSKKVWLLIIPFLTMVIITSVQIFSGSDQLALLYPWRISVYLVPVSSAILFGKLIKIIYKKYNDQVGQNRKLINNGMALIVLILVVTGGLKFFTAYQTRVNSDEQKIFNFIWKNKKPGQVYMIPIEMESFRLETGAAAFVDFKSVPTKDADVVDWLARNFQVQIFTRRNEGVDVCYQLERLSIEFGVTHVIQTKFVPEVDCPNAEEIYQDDKYLMYGILVHQ